MEVREMNWAVLSVQRLRDYEKRKQALSNIPEKIKSLEEQFAAIRSATTDATPVKDSSNRREDMLVYNIAKREELKHNYSIAKREVQLTENGLSVLAEDEKRILELFFIRRPSDHIERLCDELAIEKSTLYRKKDEALKNFTIAVYGIVEL